jgi:hypothetical protein
MAETPPVDPVAFAEDFRRMFAVATSGTTAWYNDPTAWKAPRAPYEIWEERGTAEAAPDQGRPTVTYEAWPLTEPDNRRTEQAQPDRRGRPVIRRGEPPVQYPGHVNPVTPLQTAATFGRRAPDGSSLVVVSDTLVDHLNQAGVPVQEVSNLQRCIGQLVGRSLLLGAGLAGAYSAAAKDRLGRSHIPSAT